MIIEYIRYALSEHSPAELIAAYNKAIRYLDAARECSEYELSQCIEEPSIFVLRIKWISQQAHLVGFRKGENFPPFLEEIRGFIPEIVEMRHYHIQTFAN